MERFKTQTRRARAMSNPRAFREDSLLVDPGNHPVSHFEKRMGPLRFTIREMLIGFTNEQSVSLFKWQEKHRSYLRDLFFVYTAFLGSHTFYVICLPTPAWAGYFEATKDMVYILGYSIYLSGYLKDFLCLPRPRSPPIKRITLSKYTTKEYGAPSSHSSNAVGITSLFLYNIWKSDNSWPITTKLALSGLSLFYCSTIIVGRIYCGMHGGLDLISGGLVGIVCFAIRMVFKNILFRDFNSGSHIWYPAFSVLWGLGILLKHVKPIDECPCFYDSVAFIGVISGVECCDWIIKYFGLNLVYYFETGSFLKILQRIAIGVPMVILWKYVISKPLTSLLVLKLFRLEDDRYIDDAKKQDDSNDNGSTPCKLFSGFSKVNIVARFLIYAGIPMTVMLLSPIPIVFFEK